MSEIYVSDENVELDPASTWFRKLSEGIVEPIERNVVKDFLETRCHANFTNLTEEHQKGLRAAAYGGKRRPAGMKGVWTEEGWNGIKDWLTGWAELYEQRTGDTLPKIIYRKGEPEEHIVKTEGIKGFVMDVTAYSAGAYSQGQFIELVEARLFNFHRGKSERKKVVIEDYNNNEPFAPASIPQEFPQAIVDVFTVPSKKQTLEDS